MFFLWLCTHSKEDKKKSEETKKKKGNKKRRSKRRPNEKTNLKPIGEYKKEAVTASKQMSAWTREKKTKNKKSRVEKS